jgi:hypothetical protein
MRKPPKKPPEDRNAIFEQVRQLLTEQYDCGLVVCSWEEGGETFHMFQKFGNEYAVEKLSEKTHELLFPFEEGEEDEEEDEEA